MYTEKYYIKGKMYNIPSSPLQHNEKSVFHIINHREYLVKNIDKVAQISKAKCLRS